MTTFEQALRTAGHHPREIPAGRLQRCGTEKQPRQRNGWYFLSACKTWGIWGDWSVSGRDRTGEWRDEQAVMRQPTPAELARVAQRTAADRAQRVRSMQSARAFWQESRALRGQHVYLARKGLSMVGCTGLRVHGERLVAPIQRDGRLISLQSIDPAGEKRYWTGAPVRGGSLMLDRLRAALTIIAEGLATGLAVYQCVPMSRVVVAFDCGNLLPVVDLLRPSGSVVIAADNDWKTAAKTGVNPGLVKARNAAELIGCGVAYPEGIEGTDFADAMAQWGERAKRRIEMEILAQVRYIPAEAPS